MIQGNGTASVNGDRSKKQEDAEKAESYKLEIRRKTIILHIGRCGFTNSGQDK
jgi:hypothetical protein